MIGRIWHGRTRVQDGDAYEKFLNERAIPDYTSIPGNLSVHILREDRGAESHFLTLTFWKDMDAIRAFAGDPPDKAKYYTEDQGFLLDFEPTATHYKVTGSS